MRWFVSAAAIVVNLMIFGAVASGSVATLSALVTMLWIYPIALVGFVAGVACVREERTSVIAWAYVVVNGLPVATWFAGGYLAR